MDDNLPLRKVSLTCLESILDLGGGGGGEPLLLDPAALLSVMPLLLADKDEIKLQAHQVQHSTG